MRSSCSCGTHDVFGLSFDVSSHGGYEPSSIRTILFRKSRLFYLLTRPVPEWITTPADFTRYIGGVARNTALVQNRKHLDGRHHRLCHEFPLASVSENETPSSEEPDASDLVQNKEIFADVHDWLPLRIREIVMWVLLGFSVAEVALFYEIDEKTVIMFVCTANNLRAHPDRIIDEEEAMRFFNSARKRVPKRRRRALG